MTLNIFHLVIPNMQRFALWTLTAALAATTAYAQPATPAQRAGVTDLKDTGTLHLQTALGSFRMIDGSGRVEVSFRGSILLNQFSGRVIPGPGVKKEYETPDKKRMVYHGRGTMVIIGKWRAIQFFGGDMRATWFGKGLIRITGEFDKNLGTGFYWYDDVTDKNAWFANSAQTLTNPKQDFGKIVAKPRRRTP